MYECFFFCCYFSIEQSLLNKIPKIHFKKRRNIDSRKYQPTNAHYKLCDKNIKFKKNKKGESERERENILLRFLAGITNHLQIFSVVMIKDLNLLVACY